MANPWSILGLRKSSEGEQLWQAYSKALRETSDEGQRRRARDAFEAIELGLWGRFADSMELDRASPRDEIDPWAYDGPLASELARLNDQLSSRGPIDEPSARDQIDALFDDPAMQQASTYLQVEPALAALLEIHLPRSEPLVLFALDRFRHVTDQARQQGVIARLLDRADELALLEALEPGHSELAKGWRPLARPASNFQRWLWARDDRRGPVAALYAFAGWHNPSFRQRVNPEEWAWWSRELSYERLSFGTIFIGLLVAVLIGAAAHQYGASWTLVVMASVAVFSFLMVDNLAARFLTGRRTPRPFDGSWTIMFAIAALTLPAFTRLLPPDWPSAVLVAGLAIAIAWCLRLSTGLPGGVRSSAWLDMTGLPMLGILFFALSLPIPWERYAMLASYVWLLHAVLPHLRRPVAMALDRVASLPWGYLLAGVATLLALGALFAAALDINRESTRMALLITSYALLSLSIYSARPLPHFAALIGAALIGGYLVIYCQGGGEYHPGPNPSAGETLLSAERGDVVEWGPFPANGEAVLERMKRNNPDAYARLMPFISNASCNRDPDGGRECEAYPIDGALYAEVGRLLPTMSNRHLLEWTWLEAKLREAQFQNKSGACSSQQPQFGKIDPPEIRQAHAALVLAIVASGPRPLSERPTAALPAREEVERILTAERNAAAAMPGGPVHPLLRRGCINQIARVRTILRFDTDVAARISRGGYPQ